MLGIIIPRFSFPIIKVKLDRPVVLSMVLNYRVYQKVTKVLINYSPPQAFFTDSGTG